MKRAQSTLEYAMVVVIVVAALIAMQVYLKRSMQGRLRGIADELGQQYAPKNTTSNITIKFNSDTETKTVTEETRDGKSKTTTTVTIKPESPETQTQSGSETVGKLESSLF
jgi:predicted hydrocarbon binding protein